MHERNAVIKIKKDFIFLVNLVKRTKLSKIRTKLELKKTKFGIKQDLIFIFFRFDYLKRKARKNCFFADLRPIKTFYEIIVFINIKADQYKHFYFFQNISKKLEFKILVIH